MSKRSTAIFGTACPARATGSHAKCGNMGKKVPNANHVTVRAQNRDCKDRQRPGYVATHSQEPRGRPLSVVSTSNVTPHCHQRRWSVDCSKCGTSPVITVRKKKKEPQPPQRGVSLLRPHATSHASLKRYSCPPIGISTSSGRSSSSSSSSSTASSCSSPPLVQTSAITGRDPRGWKLRPKSSASSSQAHTNRLSLQIPLPVIPAPNTAKPDSSSKTKPALRPEPSHRDSLNSDSSAVLRSLGTTVLVLTLDDLCAVNLRKLSLSDESDDVFSEEPQEEERVTARPRKVPPPVPQKTSMARQTAQLIAHSRKDEDIYASVMKPKPKYKHKTMNHNSTRATKTAGLHLDISRDRERSTTPRFLC